VTKWFTARSVQWLTRIHRKGPTAGDVKVSLTVMTAPAGPDQRHGHMITDRHVVHPRTNLGDYPGGLMAKHGGEFASPCPIGVHDVRVADGAGSEINEHFAGAGAVHRDLFDLKGRTKCPNHCSTNHDRTVVGVLHSHSISAPAVASADDAR